MNHPTREAWLEAGVELLRPVLTFVDSPRVSVGFPSKSALSRVKKRVGECWSPKCSTDGRSQIFVSPLIREGEEALAILLHELIHHKIGVEAKHGAKFRAQMKIVGLEGKATQTVPSAQCAAVMQKLCKDLGPYPHAGLSVLPKDAKKQSTRMLKAKCPACDCVVRITRQWAGENGETLPICGYCALPDDPETFVRMVLEPAKDEQV